MTIHHATTAKAQKLGFAIIETGNFPDLVVLVTDTKQSEETIGAPRPAPEVLAAAILMRTFHYEYPALNIGWDYTDEGRWLVVHTDASTQVAITWAPELPELADILELCQDKELDPEIGALDVEAPTGSVVKEHYKTLYRPHGGTSGDWLAKQLDTFKSKSGQLDIEAFLNTCEANGVDMNGAWSIEGSRGWQGRARMTGRIKLAVRVAVNNELFIGNNHITPPKAWVEAHLPKPKKAKLAGMIDTEKVAKKAKKAKKTAKK